MTTCGLHRCLAACYIEEMKISIVVPAFNEEAGLAATLGSIRAAAAAFDSRGWPVELVVCDNNSSDATAAIARDAGADVVFEPVNQISRARNTGATRASGDWLLFVDADSHPTADLFEDVAGAIAGGRCAAGGSTVTFANPRLDVRMASWAWNMVSRVARWAAGSFVFCERAAFAEVGGFSRELFAGEDVDLFRRLKRLARRQRRTIVILHRHPLRTSDRKTRLYAAREIAMFMLRTALAPGRTLRSVEHCFAWYDGRR
jgi:glycosyltransferase involved in cell wall biosynthesis